MWAYVFLPSVVIFQPLFEYFCNPTLFLLFLDSGDRNIRPFVIVHCFLFILFSVYFLSVILLGNFCCSVYKFSDYFLCCLQPAI